MAMLFSIDTSAAALLIVASVCSVAGPAGARRTSVSDSVVHAASDARVQTTTPCLLAGPAGHAGQHGVERGAGRERDDDADGRRASRPAFGRVDR